MIDRIRAMIGRRFGPSIGRALAAARTCAEILAGLEDLYTTNRIEFDRVGKELARVAEAEESEAERLRASVVESERRVVLMTVRRLRGRAADLGRRLAVLDRNLVLHQELIGRLETLQAMELAGVSADRIDRILVTCEEAAQTYEETALEPRRTIAVDPPDPDLDRIEREILACMPLNPPVMATEPEGCQP